MEKLIITAAICGAEVTKAQNEAVPYTVEEMVRPRHDVPDEDMRYGMGFWLHRTGPALVLEGYDAGASFRSTHLTGTRTTVTVLGNSSEGAWPVIAALGKAIDEELGA